MRYHGNLRDFSRIKCSRDGSRDGARFSRQPSQGRFAEWVVSAVGTPKDVSDKLGVTPGTETGTAMIFSMGSYYGRATTEIWDWIKAKAETPSVT